jgi:hypothetical protein
MATQLITPNDALNTSPGETSVLRFGGRSSQLIVANSLIPRLFDEVSEGVRSLPRGGAEIGGLLVGPKNHMGGVLANDIITIPIEYRFGPSFRLSSPDLTKIEEAIVTAHKDPSKTVVGFFRSRTRGGAEFRDSDQEILLAVELAHAAFATDFHYFLVLSPPVRSEMPLGVATRTENDWSDFRPFTCHTEPLGITSDLGDPEPEMPVEPEAAPASLEEELAATDSSEELKSDETVAAETDSPETASAEVSPAEPEAMNVHSEDSVMVETEAVAGDQQEAAQGPTRTKKATTKAAGSGPKKAKAPKAEGTAARPRAKKTTTTAKSKARSASADAAVATPSAEHKTKPHVTAADAVVAEATLMPDNESNSEFGHLLKMRSNKKELAWSQFISRISRKHLLWAAGIVGAATLAIGGYFLVAKHATPPTVEPAHVAAVAPAPTKQTLALTAERHGSDLRLSWNSDSPVIAHASFGMLIIHGKDGRKDIALTPDQLRAGSIVYTPNTDQVEVELSVVSGEQVTKDSVIVFLPRKGDKGVIVTSA